MIGTSSGFSRGWLYVAGFKRPSSTTKWTKTHRGSTARIVDGMTAAARYPTCLKALRTSMCFLVQSLLKTIRPDTLPTAGAEGKALRGCNLSAGSGAETKLGFFL